MSSFGVLALLGGAVAALAMATLLYLGTVLAWSGKQTRALGYYGLPPEERARFRARLAVHARILGPVIRIMGRLSRGGMAGVTFEVDGVPGPKGTCSEESFRRGMDYRPRPDDVFVVTAMKCGTTWMQHTVYETLCRGRGDLVDSGTALYAVSPWLEAETGVPVEEAPRIGREPKRRVIKTHLPAHSCPGHAEARFIYVSRDPVSCFASCCDFLATNMGPFCPDREEIAAWYTSKEMWWGPWTAHVGGWWDRSRRDGNVLWVRFEDMVRDLPSVVRAVAEFVGVPPLADEEVREVVRKCGFEYMRRHGDTFEMHPPHLLAADPELFVRGTADRFRDVPPELDHRIVRWCRNELGGAAFPLEELYPRATA